MINLDHVLCPHWFKILCIGVGQSATAQGSSIVARHVLKGEAAVRSVTLAATALPRGARAMECSDGSAETSMIGWTPPGRKQARAPRLSEASTAAASD